MTPDSPPIEVAVGILRDAAGRVLINQRPAGKPQAGQWEFPGGKIHAGETAGDALARELEEELGIHIGTRRPLIMLSHRYDDFAVRLNVMEVLDYEGDPVGREGQALRWVAPEDLAGVDLLAANAPIVRAVTLPRACLITDLERFGAARTLERLASHAEADRVLLIVREKSLGATALSSFVSRAVDICHRRGSLVCLHADCNVPGDDAVDGTHWPARALREGTLRRSKGIAGASCHDAEEIRLAAGLGADYALLSPVKPTASHTGARSLGWAQFETLCAAAPSPVYALGGLQWRDQETAIRRGAQGVAMISAAWE